MVRASLFQTTSKMWKQSKRMWGFVSLLALLNPLGCDARPIERMTAGVSGAAGQAMPVTQGQMDAELMKMPNVERSDRCLSPYFAVIGGDTSVEGLPLKSTSADVDIAGVIADVVVTQVYKNEGKQPIEARYVFPASTRAAVYGMKMTIGERVIDAQIQTRAQARATYEQARSEGKSTSLLEQQRPNVFEMNVANIMPGDEIKVELRYTELLVPTDGVYELVYPTVVGPRYSSPNSEQNPDRDGFVASPYTQQGQAPTYAFDFTATLSSGIPIQGVAMPTHKGYVSFQGPDMATVTLDQSEKSGGNRDLVLRYRLAGGQIQSGLMLFEGKDENFFLLMAQPPKEVKPAMIPPREYVFIVDISGSMNGFPIETSKALLRDLIGRLRPTDTFNVILFAGSTAIMAESSVQASQPNIDRAIQLIDHQRGGGGTELLPALKRALELPRQPGVARSIVVATDGYVSVEAAAFELIRKSLGDANLFAFGIGSSMNRFLMEGMARAGQGEPLVVMNPAEAPKQAEAFRRYIESPVLTQTRLGLEGFDAYDVEPLSIPDVLAERPVVVFGKYRGKAKGVLSVEGQTGEGPYRARFDASKVMPRAENSALRYLWARSKVSSLADFNKLWPNDARTKEVTDLGLKYNLLTEYTSFVAVDSLVRNTSGTSVTVDQPLPLPAGVSNQAVGREQVRYKQATRAAFPSAPAPVQAAQRQEAGSSGGALGGMAVLGTRGSGYGSGGGGGIGSTAATGPARKAPTAAKEVATADAPSTATMDMSPGSLAKGDARNDKTTAEEKDSKAIQPVTRLESFRQTRGTWESGVVATAAKQTLDVVRAWYIATVRSTPGLAGSLTVVLSVDATGRVLEVKLSGPGGSTMRSSDRQALEQLLRKLTLKGVTQTGELQVILGLST